MLRNNRDIAAALLQSGAMLVAVLLTDSITVRMGLALPLVLFTTGHLAIRALRLALPPLEHALIAVVLSITICMPGCFLPITPAPATSGTLTPSARRKAGDFCASSSISASTRCC